MSHPQTHRPILEPSGPAAADQALRRASNVSSAFELSEIDSSDVHLREDYENAVRCVVQCESVINSLQGHLASRDQEMALLREAKDREIEELERKLIDMSLELATTKAREDELQLELSTATSIVAKGGGGDQAIAAAVNAARYRPTSKILSRKHLNGLDDSLNSTLTEATAMSSFTSDTTNSDMDDSNTSRLSSMGRFLVQHCSWNEPQSDSSRDVHAQPKNLHHDEYEERQNTMTDHIPQRRRPNRKRIDHQARQSSRSFGSGVLFPVSSLEVMRGCVKGSVNEGSNRRSNEGWPEF